MIPARRDSLAPRVIPGGDLELTSTTAKQKPPMEGCAYRFFPGFFLVGFGASDATCA